MEAAFRMRNFVDELGINGHLTVIKKYNDGTEEVVFDDHNIIVSGMGVGLSYLFTGSGSDSILNYQIDRFQVGTSGNSDLEVSTTYSLSGAVSSVELYGTGSNTFVEQAEQIKNDTFDASAVFALIPHNKITRIGDNSVRYTLVIDEEACNSLTGAHGEEVSLNEVGLLVKNPTGYATNRSILAAYRNFSNIYKTSDFSLIFRWTLNF